MLYLLISKQGTSFHKRIVMVFNETTNYNFILPGKTYQRHSQTTASNFWDLVQSDQSPIR